MDTGLKLYTLSDVSRKLNISSHIVKNWYRWAKSEYNKTLKFFPEPKRDEKGRMWFTTTDIDDIRHFKDTIRYGMMSEFNRRYK